MPTLTGLYQDPVFIPYDLKCLSLNQNELKLTWSAPISGIMSGYEIYRSFNDSEALVPIGYVTGLNFIDSGLEQLRTYYYRITSISSGDFTSGYDPNYIPQNLRMSCNGDNLTSTLSWLAPTNIVSGYRVWRSSGNFAAQMNPLGETTNVTYIDSGLTLNFPYYYRVSSLF